MAAALQASTFTASDELTAINRSASLSCACSSVGAEAPLPVIQVHELADFKSPVEMELMRTVKNALDPKGLLNPGKVLPPTPGS